MRLQISGIACATATIWIIGIALMICLTVRDLLPLISDYVQDNVETKVTVIRNATVRRPNVTVCIPYYSEALLTVAHENGTDCTSIECQALEDHGWNVQSDHESRLRMKLGKQASQLIKKLLSDESSNGFPSLTLDHQRDFNWNQPLIDAVYMFFCAYREMDNIFLDKNSFLEYSIAPSCAGFDLAQLQIESHQIDQLYQKLIEAIDVYLFITIDNATDDISDLKTRPIAISSDKFCTITVAASEETFEWRPVEDDGDETPPWKRRRFGDEPVFWIWRDDTIFFANQYSNDALYATAVSGKESFTYEAVALSYSVSTTVVERRPDAGCSPDPNPSRCVITRQSLVVAKECGCKPWTYRFLLPADQQLPYCNITSYQRCKEKLLETLNQNEKDCNNICEYVVYEWTVAPTANTITEESRIDFYDVRLKPHVKPYIEFSLVTKTSTEMFISQIGGIVNLYLGFDGLTLFATLIFAYKWLLDLQRERLRRKIAKNRPENVVRPFSSMDAPHDGPLEELKRSIIRQLETMEERRKSEMEKMRNEMAAFMKQRQLEKPKEAWKFS